MKTTIKTNATPAELALIGQAERTAATYKTLSDESPLRPFLARRYDRIVSQLGYDPIS